MTKTELKAKLNSLEYGEGFNITMIEQREESISEFVFKSRFIDVGVYFYGFYGSDLHVLNEEEGDFSEDTINELVEKLVGEYDNFKVEDNLNMDISFNGIGTTEPILDNNTF